MRKDASDDSVNGQAEPRLNLFGEFASRDCEAQYRQYELRANRRQARLMLIIVMAGIPFFTLSDYILFGITTKFALLLAVRLAIILSSLALSGALKKDLRLRQFEIIGLGYLLGLSGGILYIQASRPPGYNAYAALSVLAICAFYMASPLPLKVQAIPALLLSLGTVLLLFNSHSPLDKLSSIAVIYGVACANLIGAIVSIQSRYWKRHEFVALLRETRLRQQLGRAMEEIRTLRGTIPICSYCKNVKNAPGEWQQIEAFLTTHTHAIFSHGICPQCYEKHFHDYVKS